MKITCELIDKEFNNDKLIIKENDKEKYVILKFENYSNLINENKKLKLINQIMDEYEDVFVELGK